MVVVTEMDNKLRMIEIGKKILTQEEFELFKKIEDERTGHRDTRPIPRNNDLRYREEYREWRSKAPKHSDKSMEDFYNIKMKILDALSDEVLEKYEYTYTIKLVSSREVVGIPLVINYRKINDDLKMLEVISDRHKLVINAKVGTSFYTSFARFEIAFEAEKSKIMDIFMALEHKAKHGFFMDKMAEILVETSQAKLCIPK